MRLAYYAFMHTQQRIIITKAHVKFQSNLLKIFLEFSQQLKITHKA